MDPRRMRSLLGPSWFWTGFFTLACFCVLVVCSILFALIEKPFMLKTRPRDVGNWVRGVWSRPRSLARCVSVSPKGDGRHGC